MRPNFDFLDGHSFAVYSSDGCPDCTRLAHWLADRGVAHTTVKIDRDPEAADKLENETGKQAVPFLLVDGKAWVRGYHSEHRSRLSEEVLERELRAAIRAS